MWVRSVFPLMQSGPVSHRIDSMINFLCNLFREPSSYRCTQHSTTQRKSAHLGRGAAKCPAVDRKKQGRRKTRQLKREGSIMLTRQIAVLIAASFMFFGIAGLALAGEKAAGYPIIAQDQTRDHLRDDTGDGVPDQVRAHDHLKDGTGTYTADQVLDKTQDRDRLKDNTGDGVPDKLRDHDQIHDRMGTGTGAGGMGGSMGGGMGGGGMGGGMRGSGR